MITPEICLQFIHHISRTLDGQTSKTAPKIVTCNSDIHLKYRHKENDLDNPIDAMLNGRIPYDSRSASAQNCLPETSTAEQTVNFHLRTYGSVSSMVPSGSPKFASCNM